MQFMMYWELNEDMPAEQRMAATQKLISSGLFPPKEGSIIRWDITVDNWGVTTFEANSTEDIYRAIALLRAAAPGFFKMVKTSPAMPATDSMSIAEEIMKMASA
jgi:hypothetical protein